MYKDFWKWHKKKEYINNKENIKSIYFREREVWWCALGVNVGFEQDGKGSEFRRPVLILKKFNQFVFLAVPLSTKTKENNKYYLQCNLGDGIPRSVIISQIRMLDTRRLMDKLGVLDEKSFFEIKNVIKAIL
jgi:mRNA interferase MazF